MCSRDSPATNLGYRPPATPVAGRGMKSAGKRRRDEEQSAPPAGVGQPLLTINDVASILRLHPRTVREYVRRGELKGRLIGGRWRFRRKDVDAFFDAAPSSWDFHRGSDREE